MYGRLLGYYPQLLPMTTSVLYKITGTAQETLSLTNYALHAFQPVIGFVLVIAVLRLAVVMNVAAWPSLLVLFGSATLRAELTAGAADLLATTMFTVATGLFFGAVCQQFTARRGYAAVFCFLFFGVFFAKTNNVVFLVLPAIAFLVIRLGPKPGLAMPKGIASAIQLSVILFSSFLLHQYIYIGTPPEDLRQDEFNMDPATIVKVLRTTSDGNVAASTPIDRLRRASDRFVYAYRFPTRLRRPVIFVAMAALLFSGLVRSFWPLLVTALVQFALWSQIAAYDTRNLLPALPLLGLCLTRGFGEIFARLSAHRLPKLALGLLMSLLGAWVGGRILSDIFHGSVALTKDFPARMHAIKASPSERIAHFYPEDFPAYQFLTSLRSFREANLIMAESRLYRWLPNGAYAWGIWPTAHLLPGDGFLKVPPFDPAPPDYERWTEVYDDGKQRLFLLDKAPVSLRPKELILAGDTPPRIVEDAPGGPWMVEATGIAGFVAYSLPVRNLKGGDSITWRVLVSGDAPDGGSVYSTYITSDPAIIDPKLTRVVVDTSRLKEKLIAYSGILTFSDKPFSTRANLNSILVGLAVRKPGLRVHIREFRVSLYSKSGS